jgi:alpha-glucosidase
LEFDDSVFAAITEAHLQEWSGMYLGIDRSRLGQLIFASPARGAGDASIPIDLNVEGMSTLHLVTEPVGTQKVEHTIWGGARLSGRSGSPTYLSELKPIAAIRPPMKDRRADNAALRVGGKTFERGLETTARNSVGFKLDRKYSRFQAEIGVDTGQAGTHRARFEVFASAAADSGFRGLLATLSPIPGTDGKELVRATTPHQSPWRVILVGKTPGSLIESTLIETLNPPPAFEDRSWIRPGIVMWDTWWSGTSKMEMEPIKEFIAFAGEHHLPYHLIDAGWYGAFDRPGADVTAVTPGLDLAEIRRDAAEKNVRLWLWVHWSDLDRKLEEAFALYESWGIAGVKVDYMQRDDQEMVRWYERVVRTAANHKLMVDFHGAYKGTGEQRTWPNLMSREGVLGNEWNKWSRAVTPDHNVTVPFTRMLTGPMDYTPLGFLNRTAAEFVPTSPTQVQTTRAHQLAMLLVYESPIQCICDVPGHYRGQPGFEFVAGVPTTWDESRVVRGEIGDHIAVARRAGRSWYLGVMNGAGKRTLKVPLSFLGAGTWKMALTADAPDADRNPERVAVTTEEVTPDDDFRCALAPGGGAVARFDPVP